MSKKPEDFKSYQDYFQSVYVPQKPKKITLDDRIKQAVLNYMDSFTQKQMESKPLDWWYTNIKEYVMKALSLKNRKKLRKRIKYLYLEELLKLEKSWKYVPRKVRKAKKKGEEIFVYGEEDNGTPESVHEKLMKGLNKKTELKM